MPSETRVGFSRFSIKGCTKHGEVLFVNKSGYVTNIEYSINSHGIIIRNAIEDNASIDFIYWFKELPDDFLRVQTVICKENNLPESTVCYLANYDYLVCETLEG